jgi:hypothetical protein
MPSSQPPQPRLPWPEVGGLVVCTALAVVVFAEAWAAPTTSPNGGGVGDGALLLWFLRWTPYALGHGLNPLHGTYLNVPDGVNLMWNTSLPLPAALMGPVTATLGLPLAMTTLYTLALALSAWFASIAFRRYLRRYRAALLGGLVYGFSPAMIAQSSSHLQLTLGAVLPPLMLLLVDDILVRQRRNPLVSGAALGALAAAQLLIGEELLAFTGIAAAAMLVALLVMFPRRVRARAGHAVLGLVTALVVVAVLAGWPLAFQFLGPQRIAGDIQESSRNGNDLYGFVVPTRVMAVAPAAALEVSGRFVGRVGELNGYLGAPLVVLVVFTAVRWWRSGVVRVAFVTGLVLLLLSMGERLHVGGRILDVALPWSAVRSLPLIESAIPTRLMLTADLFFALLLAIFIDQARRWALGGRVVAMLMVAAALLALLPKVPLKAEPLRPPSFFTGEVRRIPEGSVALVAPFPTAQASRAMTWQAMAGLRFRMPGGYFVGPDRNGRPKFGPVGTKLSGWMTKIRLGWRKPTLGPGLRRELVADLVRWQVTTVVVGPMAPPSTEATMVRFFTELLGRPADRVAGVWVWWNLQPRSLLHHATSPSPRSVHRPNGRRSPRRPPPVGGRTAQGRQYSSREMVRAGSDDQRSGQGVAQMQTGARSAVTIRRHALMSP